MPKTVDFVSSDERILLEGLFISVSASCDLRCIFCYPQRSSALKGGVSDFSMPRISEVLSRTYPLLAKKELFIGGNEPMNLPDLPQVVCHARRLGFKKIELRTSSRRLADDVFMKSLIAAGVNSFNIPLYGPIASIHDAVVRMPGSFQATLAGLRFLRKQTGVDAVLHTLVINQNIDVFDQTVRLASQNSNLGYLQAWFLEPMGHTLQELKRLAVPPVVLRRRLERVSHRCRFLGFPLCFLPLWVRRLTKSWMTRGLRHETLCFSGEKWKLLNGVPYHVRHPEKFSVCRSCPWRSRCRSIHPDYLELFGGDILGFAKNAHPVSPDLKENKGVRPSDVR